MEDRSIIVGLVAADEARLDTLEEAIDLLPVAGEGREIAVRRRAVGGEEAQAAALSLPPAGRGWVLVLEASLLRPEDESPVELWRDLTEDPEAPALVLYADEPVLRSRLDLTFGRATRYVGARRPDSARKLAEAVRLAARGVRTDFS